MWHQAATAELVAANSQQAAHIAVCHALQERASKGLPQPGQHAHLGAVKPWDSILSRLEGHSSEHVAAMCTPTVGQHLLPETQLLRSWQVAAHGGGCSAHSPPCLLQHAADACYMSAAGRASAKPALPHSCLPSACRQEAALPHQAWAGLEQLPGGGAGPRSLVTAFGRTSAAPHVPLCMLCTASAKELHLRLTHAPMVSSLILARCWCRYGVESKCSFTTGNGTEYKVFDAGELLATTAVRTPHVWCPAPAAAATPPLQQILLPFQVPKPSCACHVSKRESCLVRSHKPYWHPAAICRADRSGGAAGPGAE